MEHTHGLVRSAAGRSAPEADYTAIPVNGGPFVEPAVRPLKLHALTACLASLAPAVQLVVYHPCTAVYTFRPTVAACWRQHNEDHHTAQSSTRL